MILQTSKWRLAIGIALLALTPVIAFDHGWLYWQLASDGVTAPAVVTKVERQRHRKRFDDYYANYEFTDHAEPGGRRSAPISTRCSRPASPTATLSSTIPARSPG